MAIENGKWRLKMQIMIENGDWRLEMQLFDVRRSNSRSLDTQIPFQHLIQWHFDGDRDRKCSKQQKLRLEMRMPMLLMVDCDRSNVQIPIENVIQYHSRWRQ